MADLRTIASAEDARKEILTKGFGNEIEDGEGGSLFLGTLRASGINFNASGGNTLEDYELGTWTPDMDDANILESNGIYIRIGDLCMFSFYMNFGSASSQNSRITGFPFLLPTQLLRRSIGNSALVTGEGVMSLLTRGPVEFSVRSDSILSVTDLANKEIFFHGQLIL